MRGTLAEKLARSWFRGSAFRRGDLIVMNVKRAERYEPMFESGIGIALTGIRNPADAVAFVNLYGLLRMDSVLEGEQPPTEVSQPYADFERAADDLRGIARTILDVQKANRGERSALVGLRSRFGPRDPEATITVYTLEGPKRMKARELRGARAEDFADVDDRTILTRASDWAAWGLNNGLLESDARPYVFEPAQMFPNDSDVIPGGLRIGVLPETLLGFCYLSMAEVASKEPLGSCEECQNVFQVEDRRQKFCNTKCANRARFRRFKQRQADTLTDTLQRGREQKRRTRTDTKKRKR
jgi:hypothetical protein